MPVPTLQLPVALSPSGLADARRTLDDLQRLVLPPPAIATAEAVYRRATTSGRTRELLQVLMRASQPLTPTEIGAQLAPPLAAKNVRAILRNLQRVQHSLLKENAIDREVLIKDFSQYGTTGAGRYCLSDDDKAVLQDLVR